MDASSWEGCGCAEAAAWACCNFRASSSSFRCLMAFNLFFSSFSRFRSASRAESSSSFAQRDFGLVDMALRLAEW